MQKITVGSLFAGIGGPDLGLERAGFQVKWQVEVNDYATKVLKKHWPDVTRFRDVRECHGAGFCDVADAASTGEWSEVNRLPSSGREAIQRSDGFRFRYGADTGSQGGIANCSNCLEPVDLICGGFPCQDVSFAGKRAGLSGKRTTLWSEFARLIRELRPRWVLAENVPGLYSASNGRFFGQVLRDLAESGYDAEWDCIPAQAVGAPHRRYRVFIVAHAHEYAGNTWGPESTRLKREAGIAESSENVAHAAQLFCNGCNDNRECRSESLSQSGNSIEETRSVSSWWAVEPDVGRVAHGIPRRVDRLRCLGNAVVPQVAQWVGERIIEQAEDL